MPNDSLPEKTKKTRVPGHGYAARLGGAKLRTGAAGWGKSVATFVVGLALLPLLLACDPDAGAPPAPPDLLTPDALVSVLADLHLAEARAQHAARAADTIQALYQQQETAALARRAVTRPRFEASYAYYAGRPAELEAIYAALTDTLSLRLVHLRVGK